MDGLHDFLSTFWDILGSLVRLGANILTQQKPLELLEEIPLVGQNGTTSDLSLFTVKSWSLQDKHTQLVGGLEHFLVFRILGRIIPTD